MNEPTQLLLARELLSGSARPYRPYRPHRPHRPYRPHRPHHPHRTPPPSHLAHFAPPLLVAHMFAQLAQESVPV
jgi:hypothetical protein